MPTASMIASKTALSITSCSLLFSQFSRSEILSKPAATTSG